MPEPPFPIVHTADIYHRIGELAAEINGDYKGKKPVVIGVLKGSFVFLGHLAPELRCDPEFDFTAIASYGSSRATSGTIRIIKDLQTNINNRHVLIIEDIWDTGLTLDYLVKSLEVRNPKSIEVCALLAKKVKRRQDAFRPKYIGFKIPNKFVVGFGLDFAEKYRELPYVGILDLPN